MRSVVHASACSLLSSCSGSGSATSRRALLLVFAFLAGVGISIAQTTTPPKPAAIKPEELANEWFIRLNELDDWYISYDGKEENQKIVDRFLELYAEDAFHQVGPSATQIGPVIFHGKDAIRKWADDFSKRYVGLNYRIEYKTRKEKPLQPFYTIQFPWGGTGASTQFEAIFTNREDRRQFVVPGAVFFMFDESGKIDSVRIYLLRDETAEIASLSTPTPNFQLPTSNTARSLWELEVGSWRLEVDRIQINTTPSH